MVADDVEMANVEGMAVAAAKAVIVAIAAVQEVDTKKAMVVGPTTDLLTKEAAAGPIQAVQPPGRIRKEAETNQIQAKSPGTKNRQGSRGGKRRGFSFVS